MKKTKTPTAVTTAVLTLITIFVWAGFEIYRSLTLKPTSEVPTAIINPLDPTLDTKSLNELPQRLFLNDNQIATIQVQTPTPLPTPTPSASPTASSSASPSATP